MKLNWFSPLPPAKTDIAAYTARILPALSEQAQITLWTDQTAWDRSLENYATVRHYTPQRPPWPDINRADASFYNIGNNPLFHSSIWQMSRRHPGIVVLHDLHLHHFFDGIYRSQWRDMRDYLIQMARFYGEQGRRDAFESFKSEASGIDRMAERYPLTLLALENAFGVIVHTEAAFKELTSANRWGVAYAPLPFPAMPESKRKLIRRAVDDSTATRPPYRLIVFGYIGRNRRIDALLKALSRFPEKARFHLDIYGQVEGSDDLRERIHALGLTKQVSVCGFVSEERLSAALAASDLVINLRYPTVGEASGSQLRAWAHALPSLVTKIGWYANLPEEAVAHVCPLHEVEDIQMHLAAFLDDPERFVLMGEHGRQLLEKQHSPEGYVKTIIDMASQAKSLRARGVAFRLSERAGRLMSGWLDSSASDDALSRVSEEIGALTLS